jgi:hypothetical protein
MLTRASDAGARDTIGLLLTCQQGLGALHDCAARLTVASEIAGKINRAPDIAEYLEDQQAELMRLLREAPAHWETLRDPLIARLLMGIIATL